ncbi:HEAT repeat domain-containing protein [bacterium]|nr:HEAT repeat domain-containing protein [bacterium]
MAKDYSVNTVKSLIKNLGSESWIVRQKTALILSEFGEMILPYLAKAVFSPNSDVCYWSIRVMGMIGLPSIRYLEKLLSSDDIGIKLAAIGTLGEIKSQRCTRLLLTRLGKEKWKVSNEIVNSLVKLGKGVIKELEPYTKSKNEDIRYWVTILLGRFGDVSIPYLASLSKSRGKKIRFYAAKSLGEVKSVKALPILIKLLEDKNWSVRTMAVQSIKNYGPPIIDFLVELLEKNYNERNFFIVSSIISDLGSGVIRKLLNLVRKDVGSIPFIVEKLLMNINQDDIKFQLIDLLDDPDDEIKSLALTFIGKLKIENATDQIFRLLASKNWKLRKEAANAIVELSGKHNIERLKVCIRDKDENVRYWAAKTLGMIGDDAILPLISALADKDSDIRYLAIACLAESPNIRSVVPLINCLTDDSWHIRLQAAETLVRIGNISLTELVKYLNSPDPDIKYWCNWVISNIGDSAVPVLANVLKETKDKEMKLYAAFALAEIGDSRAIPSLLDSLKNEMNSWVKKYSATALGKLRSKKGLELMLNLLPYERDDVAQWFVDIIKKNVENILPLVKKRVTNLEKPKIAAYYVQILSEGISSETAKLLIPMFVTEEDKLIDEIKKALSNIGKNAIKPLCEGLISDEWSIRKYCSDVLVELGKQALPALQIVMKIESKNAKYWANTTIRKIKTNIK